jgi:hypothetical protein
MKIYEDAREAKMYFDNWRKGCVGEQEQVQVQVEEAGGTEEALNRHLPAAGHPVSARQMHPPPTHFDGLE